MRIYTRTAKGGEKVDAIAIPLSFKVRILIAAALVLPTAEVIGDGLDDDAGARESRLPKNKMI